MRIFTVLGILFYATVLILIGVGLSVFALNILPAQNIYDLLSAAQNSINSRIVIGLAGVLLILISFSFAQLILGRMQREKTIAFHTPSGRVTIALSAIEDLIKHTAVLIPEIRDVKPDVIANKKGLLVNLRVALRSEANLPELTMRLQEITKAKIQEVLALEGEIVIRIHISKIVMHEEKDKKKKDTTKSEPAIPFSSFGRV